MSNYSGKGFVKISRSVQNTNTYNNMMALGVYTHCLIRAVFSPTIVYGRNLKAGQFITSCKKFAEECNLQETKMRRILDRLKNDNLITIETPRRSAYCPTNEPAINGMVITVVNYGDTGDESDKDDELNNEQNGKEPNIQPDEQTDNNIRTKNKKKIMDIKDCATPERDKSLSSIAERIAEHFVENGFAYDGTGRGGLTGLLISKLKEGYSENDLMTAFDTYKCESSRRRKQNQVGYYLIVLESQNVYGPEKRGKK